MGDDGSRRLKEAGRDMGWVLLLYRLLHWIARDYTLDILLAERERGW